MDINPNLGVKKAKCLDKESYGKKGDRIERESLSFHQNVRKGYELLIEQNPDRIAVIDAEPELEVVVKNAMKVIHEVLVQYE